MVNYNLQIEIRDTAEQGLVVMLKGELDQLTVRDLREKLTEMSAEKTTELVFDMAELEFMASAGLSVFAHYYDLFKQNESGQQIKIINCHENVLKAFKLTKMDELLNVS